MKSSRVVLIVDGMNTDTLDRYNHTGVNDEIECDHNIVEGGKIFKLQHKKYW